MVKTQSSGYILIFALMFMSILVLLLNQLYTKSVVHAKFVQTMIEREKAKLVAFGGVQLAMSYLSDKDVSSATPAQPVVSPEVGRSGPQQKTPDETAKIFMEKLLPVLNRWQTIELNEKTDGIEGTIKLCLMCEEGKININTLYDFDSHTFINEGKPGDGKKVLQYIFTSIKPFIGERNLFEEFEKFLKQRHYKLNDITELLTIKDFDVFKECVFYEPLQREQKKQHDAHQKTTHAQLPSLELGRSGQKKKPLVYLTDIFSIWPHKPQLEPWLLSDSLCEVLNFKRTGAGGSADQAEKEAREALKNFKKTIVWQQEWNKILLPMYGKDFNSISKEISAMFSGTFEPKIFSVLCYGTVGQMTQKLFVILERLSSSGDAQGEPSVKIKRIYWL